MDDINPHGVIGKTLPHAICLAALKVIQKDNI